MKKEEKMPTEREWLLMEAIWDGEAGITSSDILKRVQAIDDMSDRTERVLLHHLVRKNLVGYTVDEHDSRVYHYFAKKNREECLAEKKRLFIDTYYRGSQSGAVASFLQGAKLSDKEIKELEKILKQRKKHG
ncbi:MAG: BlaI/MecI/CopY family transcriptional regulator [Lachnospiraceae bacterium]|nr:BlaI/MecI/CopY family transcriptional regulator [Lachnospiraceae bacterium]